MKKTYRCSCCDEIKSEKNLCYKAWSSKVKPENSPIVKICRKCNYQVNKSKVGVKEYLIKKGEL